MKEIIIKCSRCDIQLANELEYKAPIFQNHFLGEEIIERGYFSIGDEDISLTHENRLLINNRDSKLLKHKDLDDYMGCCGYNDTDDLNQICYNCGLPVATIVTECYTYHYLAFDKDKINIVENEK